MAALNSLNYHDIQMGMQFNKRSARNANVMATSWFKHIDSKKGLLSKKAYGNIIKVFNITNYICKMNPCK